MSRLPRLLRALHTSVPRLETGVAPAAGAAAAAAAPAEPQWPAHPSAGPAVKFTPKGRPIHGRPPRTARVTLPSGFPEPPSYPPPPEYFEEIQKIEAELPEHVTQPRAHPLWAFFRVPAVAATKLEPGATMPDMGSLERLDDELTGLDSGRAWAAAELRNKSFEDLHTLWYVLLRERNVLATQREERARLGIADAYGGELLTKRSFRCRKSMARIKYVLNERRLALIAAGAAEQPEPQNVVAPTRMPGVNDPSAAVEALHGAAPPPIGHLVNRHSHKSLRARKARKAAAVLNAPVTAQEQLFEDAEAHMHGGVSELEAPEIPKGAEKLKE